MLGSLDHVTHQLIVHTKVIRRYRGQKATIRQHAPRARDFASRRCRHRGVVDEVARGKNRSKSRIARRQFLRS
jgi:hypothetical protein